MGSNPALQTIIENQLRLKGFIATHETETFTRYINHTGILLVSGDTGNWMKTNGTEVVISGTTQESLISYLRIQSHQGPSDYVEMEQ